MKNIIIFLLLLFLSSKKTYSQELSLVGGIYQITQAVSFESGQLTVNQVMSKFNNWLIKIDTLHSTSTSASAFNGFGKLNFQSDHILKFDFSFETNDSSYTYLITNCKFISSNSEENIEAISDQSVKDSVLLFLNDHLSEITKTLNTELQDL